MNADFIVILVLNQLLNILIMVLAWRYLKPRLRGANGHTGMKGDRGNDGKSAYQLALENGFQGSLDNFLRINSKKKVLHEPRPYYKT